MFSVIIPAHNEENVIGRCLDALLAEGHKPEMEIIVVCNGCSDRTAEIAGSYSGVTVVDISTASKIAALNAGDDAATVFPRVYLDADITCNLAELATCINNMQPHHKVSAPASKMELSSSSWLVKAYFKTWMQLPYYKSGHMVGSGIYILTQEGRERFERWPDIIGDDAFVRALFRFDEIYVDRNSSFTIFAPKKMGGLIKIRTRARFGNMQIESRYPEMKVLGENSNKVLLGLLFQQPWNAISWAVYVGTQLIIMNKCKEKMKAADFSTWERDESARS